MRGSRTLRSAESGLTVAAGSKVKGDEMPRDGPHGLRVNLLLRRAPSAASNSSLTAHSLRSNTGGHSGKLAT